MLENRHGALAVPTQYGADDDDRSATELAIFQTFFLFFMPTPAAAGDAASVTLSLSRSPCFSLSLSLCLCPSLSLYNSISLFVSFSFFLVLFYIFSFQHNTHQYRLCAPLLNKVMGDLCFLLNTVLAQ